MTRAKRFLLKGRLLRNLGDQIIYHYPCVSVNTKKNCHETSEHKIAVCEKTAGLRSGNSSDSNSACLKIVVPVKMFRSKWCKMKLNDNGTQQTA